MRKNPKYFVLIRVWPPIFTFAFDEELFRFQYEGPAFKPLFQFPPTWASLAFQTPFLLIVFLPGGEPPDPPKEVF